MFFSLSLSLCVVYSLISDVFSPRLKSENVVTKNENFLVVVVVARYSRCRRRRTTEQKKKRKKKKKPYFLLSIFFGRDGGSRQSLPRVATIGWFSRGVAVSETDVTSRDGFGDDHQNDDDIEERATFTLFSRFRAEESVGAGNCV